MISFNLLYWNYNNCDIRKENACICWNELKNLVSYLKNEKNIKADAFFYEFGKTFQINDSIKVYDEDEYFNKAKKINFILKNNNSFKYELFSLVDGDTFFSKEDYEKIYLDIIKSYEKNIFITYNLWDILENERAKIINNQSINHFLLEKYKKAAMSRHSSGFGTLGGFFISPHKPLIEIGGFNEKFKTWGAEDDEAYVRLKSKISWEPKNFFGPFHLFHPKDLNDKKYYIPVFSNEYFEVNDVNKDRIWI